MPILGAAAGLASFYIPQPPHIFFVPCTFSVLYFAALTCQRGNLLCGVVIRLHASY